MFRKKNKNKIIESRGDRIMQGIIFAILLFILIIVAYPVIYVVSCSFSGADAINGGKVLLWPVNPTLAGYKFAFSYQQVWIGYRNTIFYTVVGTSISIVMIVLMAYPISRPKYQGKSLAQTIFLISMLVGAGLIPCFLLRHSLGLYNNIWAVLTAGILSLNHGFILRTAFKSTVPGELYDAATIDGANDFQCLVKIALPLVKATISVLVLYNAVGRWNSYFHEMIYLRDKDLYPLQLFLRAILTGAQASFDLDTVQNADMLAQIERGTEQIKYALIVVSTVPVLALYAVVQKYFEKGVMLGSVKG